MKFTGAPFALALATGLLWGGHADAQVRGRVGVHVGGPRAAIVVGGGYYGGFYSPYYDPFFYGGFYRPFYFAPQYGYGGYYEDASLRIEVKPREAEVYVDNYFAGIVDDFDGVFQRLHVAPGSHTLTLYMDGYHTVHQQIYVQPTGTFRVKYEMQRLAPGEVAEARPVEPVPQAREQAQGGAPLPQGGPGQYGPGPYGPYARPPRRPVGPPPPYQQGPPSSVQAAPPQQQSEAGTLSVRVQPEGADVIVDGQHWSGPSGDERLLVQVSAGQHHVEVRHEGYRTYQSDVEVRPSETSMVNVSLSKQ